MMDRSKTSLVENTLFGTEDIVEKAVKEIQATAKTGRLCLRFSGGKDSVVVKRLLDMAGQNPGLFLINEDKLIQTNT